MNTIQKNITHENLLKFLEAVRSDGRILYGPQEVKHKTFFKKVEDVESITFDYVQTTESPKAVLFPRVERLISYEKVNGEVKIVDHAVEIDGTELVLFGSRPCDAVAMKLLADFFERDTPDTFVKRRRGNLTIISMSCVNSDEYCFCTSAKTSPGDTSGSDILLTPVGDNSYYAEILTEKGNALHNAHGGLFTDSETIEKEKFLAKVENNFSTGEVTRRLSKAFSHPLWNDAALRCIGCGTCAYVCPVCSCFDIQDEGNYKNGVRLRCWDSCGFANFTLHTSGHNPRPTQSARWRQRVMHKFSYWPEDYGTAGCVGCGRCSRACPADMNLKEQLKEIVEKIEVS
ncbi:MAG TPA: 4Fe-4S dicluster domain-containing protein [Candidatus Kryptonia bacterium]